MYDDPVTTNDLATNGSVLDRLKLVRERVENSRRSGDASMLFVPIDILDKVIEELDE